jgi:hypothetical protein
MKFYRTYACVAEHYKIIKFHVTEVFISKRHMGPLNDKITQCESTGHEAHGFALSYFTPAYGRAVDRSPVSWLNIIKL